MACGKGTVLRVKYCGGCNPHFRREEIEEILRKKFQIFYSGEADLVVCINGCKKGCAAEKVSENYVSFDEKVDEKEVFERVLRKLSADYYNYNYGR